MSTWSILETCSKHPCMIFQITSCLHCPWVSPLLIGSLHIWKKILMNQTLEFYGFIMIYVFQTIHVWYIHLHLVDFYGKCRQTCHSWMVWVLKGSWFHHDFLSWHFISCIDHWKSASDSVTSSQIYGIDEFVRTLWLLNKISTHYPKCFFSNVLHLLSNPSVFYLMFCLIV